MANSKKGSLELSACVGELPSGTSWPRPPVTNSVTGMSKPTAMTYCWSRLASPESFLLVWSLTPPLNVTTEN